MEDKAEFGHILIAWYKENRRELPWRETKDPYLIWISEIILQQTRVVQGLDYFRRFISRFPDIRSLAEAAEDEVMKYWEGLGYYSRARNLHAAARDILQRFGGIFPSSYADVRSLKGIGEYTAAAVCSFAWKQPYAVVDGNVYRVLSRVFGIEVAVDTTEGKKLFATLAGELLLRETPDIYNQAIMDFGAVQCVPKSPACLFCPLRDECIAFARGKVNTLPVKQGKTVVKPRYFNYLHLRWQGKTLLAQRRENDIWQKLYEFPLIETNEDTDFAGLSQTEAFGQLLSAAGCLQIGWQIGPLKHVLSHRVIYARFYEIEIDTLSPELQNKYLVVNDEEFGKYAVSRLIGLYLEKRTEYSRK